MTRIPARPLRLSSSSPFARALAKRAKWPLVLGALATLALTATLSYAEDWNQLQPPGAPEARFGQSVVTLSDGRVMLFGGEGIAGDFFNDLHLFNGNQWRQEATTNPPSPRSGQSMVTLSDGRVVLFGGEDATAGLRNDLHIWNPNGSDWAATPANSPPPARKNHTSWQSGDRTYIAGGKDAGGNDLKDLWFYDLTTNGWQRGEDAPFPFSNAGTLKKGDRLIVGAYSQVLSYYEQGDEWLRTPR